MKRRGGSVEAELHDRLLAGAGRKAARTSATPVDVEEAAKRKRGRPKVYVNEEAPTSTERAKRSVRALTLAGGKRIMLRLTPEARKALQLIMALSGTTQETAAINQVLMDRMHELLNASKLKPRG